MPNYIYFIQAGDERGPIKIGFSADVEKRLASLRTGNHERLEVIAKIMTDSPAAVESRLHEQFADLRLEGEWFKFDERIAMAAAALTIVDRCSRPPYQLDDGEEHRFGKQARVVLDRIRDTPVRLELGKR